jgi:hypothetical protein
VTLAWRDRPAVPALVLFVVATAYVLLHLDLSAHGDISRFVVAGRHHVVAPTSHLYVDKGDGFDGQFEYRLALAPWDLTGQRGGIALDVPFRAQRITYPALAWLLSGFGRPALLPYALVGVNLLAIAGLGWLGGRLARSYGRSALWGLALGLYFGFVWTIGRDLTELTDVACLVAGVLGVREKRWWLGALGFAAAVLSRETSLVVVFAYGLWQLPRLAKDRRPGRPDLVWAVPLGAFVLWQAYGRWRLGVWPIRSDQANAGQPFVDLAHWTKVWVTHATDNLPSLVRLTEVITVAAAVVLALVLTPWRDREGYLGVGVLLLGALGASLSTAVWIGPADLRVLASLYAMCVVAMLRSRRAGAAVALGCVFGLTVLQLVASAYHRVPIT